MTYGVSLHRHGGGQEENNGYEECPETRPGVHNCAEGSHVPWSRLELSKAHFAENGDDVTPVKSNSADVENTRDGSVRSKTNQVDGDREEHADPNGINWGSSLRVYVRPDVGKWDQAITGKCKDGPTYCLHGGEANKFDDDESADREEDTGAFAETVVVDLSNGLSERACEDLSWIAHTET